MRESSHAGRRAKALLATVLLATGCTRLPQPRNVLLIVVDTLRADHLGVYGYERPTSPHLDRWAERAVVFERAFSTSSWTLPAFGSILTGLPPSAHGGGFRSPGAKIFYDRTAIDEGVTNLAQRLQQAGFATYGLVNNPFLKARFGMGGGFDSYRRYGRKGSADRTVRRALAWVAKNGEGPFFMMLHFMEPHAPYRPPEPFRGRFTGEKELRKVVPGRLVRAQAERLSESDREHLVGRYDEEILALDHRLGRLFEGLGDRWSDTLVLFTSDHGEELFDHGSFGHGHTMMQDQLHVPMLLWAPGLEPRRVGSPVSLADVTPTVLEALGQDVEMRHVAGAGRSLWDTASGRDSQVERDLIAEMLLYGTDQKVLVRWPHKMILTAETGERQLFDLDNDPEESRDLSSDLPELADRMEKALRRYIADDSGRSETDGVLLDSETLEELEALGYVN